MGRIIPPCQAKEGKSGVISIYACYTCKYALFRKHGRKPIYCTKINEYLTKYDNTKRTKRRRLL